MPIRRGLGRDPELPDGPLPVSATVDERVEAQLSEEGRGKDPAAVALGRKGGLKGGAARAAALSPERRSEIARSAAKARWAKDLEP